MLKKEIKILEQVQKYILSNKLDNHVCSTIDRGIYGYNDQGREQFIIDFNKYKLGYIKLKFRQLREKNNLPHIELPIDLLEIFYESNCKNHSMGLAAKIRQLK